MKSFLLCIVLGLSLLIGKTTHAQDSIPGPKSVADSLPGDSTKQLIEENKLLKDSLRQIHVQDSLKALTALPKAVRKDSSQDSSKIVDIFEEMAKAQDQQDQSIKKEASQQQTEKKNIEQEAEKKKKEEADAEQKAKQAIDNAKAAAKLDAINDSNAITDLKSQTVLTPKKDSALQEPAADLIKKDTIQSIFTLPEPVEQNYQDAKDVQTDSTKEMFKGQQRNKDSSKASLSYLKNGQTENATKKQVKDSRNQLFDSTMAAADSSSHQTAPLVNSVPDTAPVQDAKSHLTDTDTSSRFDFIQDSLQTKNTPFTELFKPFRTFDKQTSITSTTSLTILQQQVDYKTSADFTTQYQRTAERGGNFLFDVSVVKLNTEVETMGVQLKYNSNQGTDSTSTFAKPLFDIVGKRTFIQVDSTGKITAVDTTQLGRQVNTVLSGLSLSGGDFEVGSNFGLLASRSGINQAGQSWTDSVVINGNKRVTTYKVQSIIDGDMLVTISGTVSQTGVINSDGAVFKTHFSGTQKGKMYVDLETLLVKSRDLTLNMNGTVDYNGQSLPASAVSKIKENVSPN
ncbi:hypothetical protein SAMN05192529_11932 [Arachidicoccus rhizosphaerae]|uniref:Uncharacterized protein n=1 Tax=Arachidicoccus rhizosphaerae TaxID=551991 RepID=A0A1H4B9E3_9BACT|nr:hypothetical protein [Arachidicoccus rhizosphaerae]SEA44761.1 hypothetical protein SAMN05192529_11932 [Arachidicoccus rhizosphaerae]